MEYGRLGSSVERGGSVSGPEMLPDGARGGKGKKVKALIMFAAILIVASAASVAVLVGVRGRGSGDRITARPTQAIARTCSRTRYPSVCVNALRDFPGALAASDADLVHISVNVTLQRFGRALYMATDLSTLPMSALERSAYEDCLELLDDSVELLARSLTSVSGGRAQDVHTWLSAALTNQDTCTEGLLETNGPVKSQMSARLKNLSALVSNCLAIFAAAHGDDDFAGVPIQNRRRRLLGHGDFPEWLSRKERRLLDLPAPAIQADIIVSQDGNGTVKTIAEAIKKVPEHSTRRTIIYVRAGKYVEQNLKIGRKKTNVMMIGDGKGKTIIAGGSSVADNMTTFHTAAFAATGAGFIAKDITFVNWAGPAKHQAVALRIGADHAVIYRCQIIGYQDTLYVHSQRQFYRECEIYGTVDFIFGNAAVVLQNCTIYARKPMAGQKNTITAQNRKDPNQNTGISIHASRILATSDLDSSKANFSTYLGRPWKMYSRTVVMMSYIGDHVHPRGWLEWNATFALDTLYYGEYMNSGPGAALARRVSWPGYRVITLPVEASKFTVAQFIFGSSWLPSTGVAFLAGLST
nr:probable pectinesterase/pectinesterase inhibitor 34 [Ipomoea batatas]